MNVRAAYFLLAGLASVGVTGCLTDAEPPSTPVITETPDEAGRNGTNTATGNEARPSGSTGGEVDANDPSRHAGPSCDLVIPSAPADAVDDEEARACRCTRRPGPGESALCPAGAGQSVAARIGPEGGVLELSGTGSTVGISVEIEIPPNALSEVVSLRLTETNVAPPASFVDWSPVYHLEPEVLTCARPAAIRVPWSSNPGEVDTDLALYTSTEASACALAPIADNYINAGFNQGSLQRSGWLMVGRPRQASESACP